MIDVIAGQTVIIAKTTGIDNLGGTIQEGAGLVGMLCAIVTTWVGSPVSPVRSPRGSTGTSWASPSLETRVV